MERERDTPQQPYNAAVDLIERNLSAGRGSKTAFIDDRGSYSYSDVAERIHRCANVLRAMGLESGKRIVMCLLDTIDFPTCFLGAIEAGIVPIPLNTLLTADDYALILRDAQPAAAIVSDGREGVFSRAAGIAGWSGPVLFSGDRHGQLESLLANAPAVAEPALTHGDDVCFWLYSSGSTGEPKGVIHRHASLMATAELFGQGVLGIDPADVVYSAPKLFFAYGLGNALTFPMSVGAATILFSGRPTAEAVTQILREHKPTIFCGVPTLFNALLNSPCLPSRGEHSLRMCTSAGEALPEHVGVTWRQHTGVDIVDGIGSTEMLHIYLSNRPGAVRYGVTGRPVPGYCVRVVDEKAAEVPPGEIGELYVSGPSGAAGYWNKPEKSREVFLGEWMRTGDKFRQTDGGDYVYCGRCDEMLKVGGIWVSPLEVEAALIAHNDVFEAAVVGAPDESGLMKPMAFVVRKPGAAPETILRQTLQEFIKARLAPYKYPRWIEFVDSLPKTATGKIQRFVLQKRANQTRSGAVAH